jgi:hypothetical protein
MVYENPDGTLSIYDWKRSKNITRINNFNKFALPPQLCHLPDSNFWHYSLQLNIYRKILEEKYGKTITGLYLICIHPDNYNKSYQRIEVQDLRTEVAALFEERRIQLNQQKTI